MSFTHSGSWSCEHAGTRDQAPVVGSDGSLAGTLVGHRKSTLGASTLEPACCRASRLPPERTGLATGEQLALLHLAAPPADGATGLRGRAMSLGQWNRALWHDDRLLLFCGESHPGSAVDDLRECVAQHQAWLPPDGQVGFVTGLVRGYADTSGVSIVDVADAIPLARAALERFEGRDSLKDLHDEQRQFQTGREQAALIEALERQDTSLPFGSTARLEDLVATYLSAPHVVGHSNGTSAMLAALHGVGVGPGDEVLCPTYTWWATASPALWLGATVRFFDVDEMLRPDIDHLARALTPATRAVVVPHLWNQLVDINAVRDVVGLRVKVVEDASHVFGAHSGRAFVGLEGDAGIFSLQAQKPLAAGEGGLMVTSNQEVLERALTLGHYERIRPEWPQAMAELQRTGLGLKLRMSPLNAALAVARIGEVPLKALRLHAAQNAMARAVTEQDTVRTVDILGLGSRAHPAPYGGTVGARMVLREPLTGRAEDMVGLLQSAGIEAQREHLPMLHREPLFQHSSDASGQRSGAGSCPIAESLEDSIVALPPLTGRSPSEAREVGMRIADVLSHARSLTR